MAAQTKIIASARVLLSARSGTAVLSVSAGRSLLFSRSGIAAFAAEGIVFPTHELREDSGFELREDGTKELREVFP